MCNTVVGAVWLGGGKKRVILIVIAADGRILKTTLSSVLPLSCGCGNGLWIVEIYIGSTVNIYERWAVHEKNWTILSFAAVRCLADEKDCRDVETAPIRMPLP